MPQMEPGYFEALLKASVSRAGIRQPSDIGFEGLPSGDAMKALDGYVSGVLNSREPRSNFDPPISFVGNGFAHCQLDFLRHLLARQNQRR